MSHERHLTIEEIDNMTPDEEIAYWEKSKISPSLKKKIIGFIKEGGEKNKISAFKSAFRHMKRAQRKRDAAKINSSRNKKRKA